MKTTNPLLRVGLEDLWSSELSRKPVAADRIDRIRNAAIFYRSEQTQAAFIDKRKLNITKDPTAYVDLICKKISSIKVGKKHPSSRDAFIEALTLAKDTGKLIEQKLNCHAHQYALAQALVDKFAEIFGLGIVYGPHNPKTENYIQRIGEATGYASGSHEIIRAQIGASLEKLIKKSGKELLKEKRKKLIDTKRSEDSGFRARHNDFVKRQTKGLTPPEILDYVYTRHKLLGEITCKLIEYKKKLKSVGLQPGSVYRGKIEKPISETVVAKEIHIAKSARQAFLSKPIKPTPSEHQPSFFATHTSRNRSKEPVDLPRINKMFVTKEKDPDVTSENDGSSKTSSTDDSPFVDQCASSEESDRPDERVNFGDSVQSKPWYYRIWNQIKQHFFCKF